MERGKYKYKMYSMYYFFFPGNRAPHMLGAQKILKICCAPVEREMASLVGWVQHGAEMRVFSPGWLAALLLYLSKRPNEVSLG